VEEETKVELVQTLLADPDEKIRCKQPLFWRC
jgi:hypothetical protein